MTTLCSRRRWSWPRVSRINDCSVKPGSTSTTSSCAASASPRMCTKPQPIGWYPMWAEDIFQFARTIGVDRFTYTGISHGAGVGWNLALLHPEALRAFISVVGGPHDRTQPRTRGIGIDGANPPPMFEVPTTDPVRLQLRAQRAQSREGRWERMAPEERVISPGKLFPELETNEAVAARLSEVRVPTLLLYAAQDDIIPPEMALLACRSVQGSKLVLYQDHSHSLASEAPERLVQEVLVFTHEVLNAGHSEPPAR